MDKKVFKRTQDILIKKDIFENLNEQIEKFCINSNVLFLVEPHLFQKYQMEILEIKKYSLNCINVMIIKNYSEKNLQEILNKLNETFSLLVCFGNNKSFNFAKRITIKNNINSIFLCENVEIKEILSGFCYKKVGNKLEFFKCLPTSLVIFKEEKDEKQNKLKYLSYFSELIFYEVENFFSSVFFDEINFSFYFDQNNSLFNNYIINELNFQKNEVNLNLIDELIFYSKIKNSFENRILICLMLLSFYRGFVEKISFNNLGFNAFSNSISYLKNFENGVLSDYFNQTMPGKEKVCYQLFTVRKILLKKLDNSISEMKKYCGYMKLIDGERFNGLRKNFNYSKILNGIKTTAKVTNNKTFLKIIDNFGFLN